MTNAERSTTFAPDADAVEKRLRERYGNYRVTDSVTTMRDDIVKTPQFALNEVTFTGTAEIRFETSTFNPIFAGSGGEHRWVIGDEYGEGPSPFLVRPDVDAHFWMANCTLWGLGFDTDSLQRTARLMYADDRLALDFDSAHPISPGAADYLRRAVHLTVEERELVCESELIAGSAYRWIATCVLELFRLHGDRTTRTATAAALLAGYRRAIRFIDDYASLPITVDDIAEAAGLPTRQLDAAFRWHSPTGGNIRDELRRARLDAAHRDLLAGDPTRGDTVRDIALRWGFRPGTFAQEYRNQFGRNPRWVLDR